MCRWTSPLAHPASQPMREGDLTHVIVCYLCGLTLGYLVGRYAL